MADLVNPYANPYLPSFVNQRPRVNNGNTPLLMNSPVTTPVYSQIQPVNGFDGARAYAENNLTPGSSNIVAESDPNIARVYIVAKDQNNQTIVEGYRLVKEEEPKPITMDDLNAKMSELLERMNKLEEEKNNAKSGSDASWKAPRQQNDTRVQSGSRNGAGFNQSAGGNPADDTKRSKD